MEFNFTTKISSGLKIDTTQVVAPYDFDTFVDDTKYGLVIVLAEVVEKKAGGQQIRVDMKIADGDFKGVKVRDYLQLSGKAASKTVQFFKAVDGVDEAGNITVGLAELTGKKVLAKLKREYDEKYANPNIKVNFWYGKSEEDDVDLFAGE